MLYDRKTCTFSTEKDKFTHFINRTQVILTHMQVFILSVLKIALITVRSGPFDSGNELLVKIIVFYHVVVSTMWMDGLNFKKQVVLRSAWYESNLLQKRLATKLLGTLSFPCLFQLQ